MNVTQIEGEGGRRVSLFLSLSLYKHKFCLSEHQISTDRRNTFLTTKPLRQQGQGGGAAVFYDRDKDKCVMLVEVTGADSPSVWFEMGRWMDGQTKWEKEKRASGLVGVKKERKVKLDGTHKGERYLDKYRHEAEVDSK